MRNIIFKTVFIGFLLLNTVFVLTACDEFLDVDTDKDNPTTVALNLILPNIQVTVGQIGDANNFTAELLSVYVHQLMSRSEQDQYGAQADNVSTRNDWNNVYLVLTDIQTLIDQATESGDKVYLGIGQALKAYLGSVAVDLWGDVPFTEATQLKGGIIAPVFDGQEAIYQAVFALLDEAKSNISSGEGNVFPSTDDLFYGGSTSKWVKFINTLKLKLYNQVRLSSMFEPSDLDALVAADNFYTSSADDFQFTHTSNITPTDERNQLFQSSYVQAQVDHYISPWFYEVLKGWNPNIHTGNPDPRIPYYWANQLAPNQFPRDQGDTVTGDPNADYWDASTGFFTIRFGSIGPDRDHAVQNDATFPGIYPCGGRYDDGMGFARSSTANGTGVAPKRILTYYEFLYIQAELIQVGLMSGDASEKLREALNASFAKVDEVVTNSGTTQTVPKLVGTAAVSDFIDNVISEFDAAGADKKLEIIMTQKWVASFGDPVDIYTDYRRTGYPVLANPNGPSPEYQLDNGDGFPLNDAQTTLGNAFQLSLHWPSDEINNNSNAPSQKDPTAYKIFWDN
ncbi:SusD/RagB family nutrient-binding outer membrane lipoprotein [Aestuariivivens sediminis]|uniref:SusD/RagB family nutrient-binding outer membrane lipoprotein n=1 Tax=Aestuariivivens sediminis TaxID=2913557 RepID=UPI001F562B0F|nr:SusD/RagB family nutrient-binding outer membrane lipoprotein [Aestuariivivens sediminis]